MPNRNILLLLAILLPLVDEGDMIYRYFEGKMLVYTLSQESKIDTISAQGNLAATNEMALK